MEFLGTQTRQTVPTAPSSRQSWFIGALPALPLLIILLAGLPELGHTASGIEEEQAIPQREGGVTPDLSSLNVRLSSRAIDPPAELVKKVVVLEGIRTARPLTGEPTLAAILEDDSRHRVIVLSIPPDNGDNKTDGQIRAYLLLDLDLESRLPQLTACNRHRHCTEDRTPGVGGLGCVAFCLVEALRP